MEERTLKHSGMKGVITVEMSLLFPIILGLFLGIMNLIFYFHDKSIISGVAAETAVIGAQIERKPDEKGTIDLNHVYQQRIRGKLIYFRDSQATVEITKKEVVIVVQAKKGKMKLKVQEKAPILYPEQRIRRQKFIESKLPGQGGEEP